MKTLGKILDFFTWLLVFLLLALTIWLQQNFQMRTGVILILIATVLLVPPLQKLICSIFNETLRKLLTLLWRPFWMAFIALTFKVTLMSDVQVKVNEMLKRTIDTAAQEMEKARPKGK